jgi:hypothetical protein
MRVRCSFRSLDSTCESALCGDQLSCKNGLCSTWRPRCSRARDFPYTCSRYSLLFFFVRIGCIVFSRQGWHSRPCMCGIGSKTVEAPRRALTTAVAGFIEARWEKRSNDRPLLVTKQIVFRKHRRWNSRTMKRSATPSGKAAILVRGATKMAISEFKKLAIVAD